MVSANFVFHGVEQTYIKDNIYLYIVTIIIMEPLILIHGNYDNATPSL